MLNPAESGCWLQQNIQENIALLDYSRYHLQNRVYTIFTSLSRYKAGYQEPYSIQIFTFAWIHSSNSREVCRTSAEPVIFGYVYHELNRFAAVIIRLFSKVLTFRYLLALLSVVILIALRSFRGELYELLTLLKGKR